MRLVNALLVCLVFLALGMVSYALAQPVPPEPSLSLVEDLWSAAKAGRFLAASLLATLLVVGAIRKWGSKLPGMAWTTTRWGGWLVNGVTAAAAVLVIPAQAGVTLTFPMVTNAIVAGLGAAGLINLMKDSKEAKGGA